MLSLQLPLGAVGGCVPSVSNPTSSLTPESRPGVLRRGTAYRFDDNDRLRLVEVGHKLGRRVLAQGAPTRHADAILRWGRERAAGK